MRFPLDYYRILGVPIHGNPEQIDQAYADRLQQRSQYQYSSVTVTSRKQLLGQAYTTLADLELRQAYDEQVFIRHDGKVKDLADATELAPIAPPPRPVVATLPKVETGIEIEDYQLAGALLLLYEQGDYDTVIELGSPYLANNTQPKLQNLQRPYNSNAALSESDLSLTVSLAHFELGREQWQQRHYEAAAAKLQTGLNLLAQEGLFVEVQDQINRDLYRLRPYRILELLATEPEDGLKHQQGLEMLKSMLQDRKGIDGNGNDHSGLSVDECLKFIVQVRSYLSAKEQQELFEQESRRPSAAGTYLAAYALIARGFAEQQPAQILRARKMLQRLSGRQDINLELASCNLLLGQTDTALECLEKSQDQEALGFIRTHYSKENNLIPGLYYYTQKWLQEMVFRYFRDLSDQKVSLKAYFDDEQIQQYLESLPEDDDDLLGQTMSAQTIAEPARLNYRPGQVDGYRASPTPPVPAPTSNDRNWTQVPLPPVSPTASASASASSETSTFENLEFSEVNPASPSSSESSPAAGQTRRRRVAPGAAVPELDPNRSSPSRPARRAAAKPSRLGLYGLIAAGVLAVGGIAVLAKHLVLPDNAATPTASSPSPSPLGIASPTLAPGSPTPFPTVALSPAPSPSPTTSVSGSPTVSPSVSPTTSSTSSPTPAAETSPASSPSAVTATVLDTTGADQVIRAWQQAKAAALGKNYQVEQLSGVLTDRALKTWQSSAQEYRNERSHWEYKLEEVKVESVTSEPDKNQAIVVAQISESGNFFPAGQTQPGSTSYQRDTYRVRYTMTRQGNRWLISNMKQID